MASTVSEAQLLDVNNLLPDTDQAAADNYAASGEQNTDGNDAPESKVPESVSENIQNNSERDDDLQEQTKPMLHENSRESASPSTSTGSNPENDVPLRLRSGSRPNVPDEEDLREKLRIFLDTLRLQWTQRRIISNYALGQTVKTVVVSILVSFLHKFKIPSKVYIPNGFGWKP